MLPFFLLFSLIPCNVYAIWPFPPKRFTGNSLLDAGSLGLTSDRAIAFGDFNGDQFLDVLMLEEDRRTVVVYLWNHESFQFQKSASFKHSSDVYNVVPGDFTHTGKLDLLVMSRSGSSANDLDLTVYPASGGGGFEMDNILKLPASSLAQPIPVDLNGDMKVDLLGIPSSSSKMQSWHNIWNASEPRSPLFELQDLPFHGRTCSKLSNPHSNAVVDLNGDCLADIFLVCDDSSGGKYFQIWINGGDGFTLSQEHPLPSGTLQISVADMDRDGTMDLVFPSCKSVNPTTGVGMDCSINIAYNKQLPLCSGDVVKGENKKCRSPENLCVADPEFMFDLSDTASNDAFTRLPLNDILTGTPPPGLLVYDTTNSPNPAIPLALKLGDANLDGFPDILLISVSQKGSVPKLLYSVSHGNRRGFETAVKGVQSLETITDARGVSWIDMDEDGTLDILVQKKGGGVMFVQNNFYYDAFFLKAIVLNGACDNGWCYTEDGRKYHPFGVSYSGASYKYTVLDTSGRRSAAQVGQLPQTSYHSLQSPYSFFGLGRTNNYIENLFVGTATDFINMEGVIPNSKVVILPGKPGEAWKKELFLRPGEWIPWVTVTFVVATVVLAGIVGMLHLSEKREDELDRRRASHRINFDAL